MRRILLMLTVAAIMAGSLVFNAVPAQAQETKEETKEETKDETPSQCKAGADRSLWEGIECFGDFIWDEWEEGYDICVTQGRCFDETITGPIWF